MNNGLENKEERTKENQIPNKDKKSWKQAALKVAVSAVLLFIIFSKVDTKELAKNIRLLDFRYAIFAPIFIIIHYCIGGMRWKMLLPSEEARQLPVKYLIASIACSVPILPATEPNMPSFIDVCASSPAGIFGIKHLKHASPGTYVIIWPPQASAPP